MSMKPEEYIADLYELKKSLMRPLSFESRGWVEPNITYTVIETLIAVFMDKYKVDYRRVEQVFRERRTAKELLELDKTKGF